MSPLQVRRPVAGDDLLGTHAPARSAIACAAVAVVAAVLGLVVTGGVPAPAAATTVLAVGLAWAVRRRPRTAQVVGVAGALATAVWIPGVVGGAGVLAMWPVVASALAVRQFATVRTVQELRLVLALAALVCLAAAGIAPSNALIGPMVLVWVAVLAGLACSVPHRPVDAAALRRVGVAVLASSAAALLAFLLVPAPAGAAFGGSAWARAAAQAVGGVSSVNRTAAAYAGGSLDLNARGELGETELLQVPRDSPALWRAGVLDTYDGRTWTSSQAPVSWTAGTATAADGSTGTGWTATVEEGASPVGRTDVVTPVGDYPALVSAGSPVGVATSARLVDNGSGVFLAPASAAYAVSARVVPTVEQGAVPAGSGSAAAAPADVERWLQVPDSVPSRVRDLGAQLTAQAAGDPVAAARAVTAHLQSVAVYSLDAPVPGRGEDAVDAFVFGDRIGFCEHFATAEVVLLRAAGFPARLVTGFAGGDPLGGAAADRRVLRSSDAHAWVEVWVPGAGWVSSDPTAGATLAQSAGRSWWRAAWSWLQLRVDAVLSDAGSRTTAAAVVAVLVVLGWLLVRASRRRGDRRVAPVGAAAVTPRERGRRGDAAVTALLVAVERFDASLPVGWRRGAAEGLSHWRERLTGAGAVPAAAPEGALAALAIAERACFARTCPARAELEAARGALEEASSSSLAAAQAVTGPVRTGPG